MNPWLTMLFAMVSYWAMFGLGYVVGRSKARLSTLKALRNAELNPREHLYAIEALDAEWFHVSKK